MRILDRFFNRFTQGGREDELLLKAMDLAKDERPQEAIDIYNQLLDSHSISDIVRARALFNRALAHSSLNADEAAISDLKQVVAMSGVPGNVLAAAKTQLARVRKRADR